LEGSSHALDIALMHNDSLGMGKVTVVNDEHIAMNGIRFVYYNDQQTCETLRIEVVGVGNTDVRKHKVGMLA
jgi:uncharacterized protein (UPF0179 family)